LADKPVTLAPGSRQAVNDSAGDGIANEYHDNRDHFRCLFGYESCFCTLGDENVYVEAHQFSSEVGKKLGLPEGRAALKDKVLAFGVAKLAQPQEEICFPNARNSS